MNVEDVKAKTTYIAVEIVTAGYSFGRFETCPPMHEHLTPAEATLCLRGNPRGNAVLAVYGEVRENRVLTTEEQEEIIQFWKSRSRQKTG